MPASCSAYGCTNRHYPGTEIHFYRFPLKRKDLLKSWIHAVRRKNFHPTKHSFICSNHFHDTDFLKDMSLLKKLNPDAVPSIFDFPEHLRPKRIKERHTYRVSKLVVPACSESESSDVLLQRNDVTDGASENVDAILCAEDTVSGDKKFVTTSSQTDLKEFAEKSIQTEDTLLPCIVRHVKEENRVLKQRVKRQSISIKSLKDLLRTLRNQKLVEEDYATFLTSHFKG